MRAVLTLLSVLLALVIVGVLAKRQWGAIGHTPVPTLPTRGSDPGTAAPAPAAARTPAQQVQQVQQAVEGLVQQPRVLPDDAQ